MTSWATNHPIKEAIISVNAVMIESKRHEIPQPLIPVTLRQIYFQLRLIKISNIKSGLRGVISVDVKNTPYPHCLVVMFNTDKIFTLELCTEQF